MDPHEFAAVWLLLAGSLFFIVASIHIVVKMVRKHKYPLRTTHCDEGIHDCVFCRNA